VQLKYNKDGLTKRFANGFNAIKSNRRDGLSYQSGTADYFMRDDREELVDQSRSYDRNHPIYESVINRAVDNILGAKGFTLNAQTPSKEVNTLIETELWKDFAMYPEVMGVHTWREVEAIILRDTIVAGDILANKVRSKGQLQLIESERISSPFSEKNVEQGVEKSRIGKPLRYWVETKSDTYSSGTYDQINARDCIFVANLMKRSSATRGIPALVSSFPNLHRINDILDSEAIAWQLLARFAISITRKEGGSENSTEDPQGDSDTSGDVTTRINDVDQGTMFWGEEGEEIKGIQQDRPASNFPESIRMYIRLLANPLGIPLELALLDWSQTNYSSARASLIQADLVFEGWQRLLIRQFHTRVYKWKVGEWMRKGLIPNDKAYLKHEWITPPFPWVDPEKEAKAVGLMLDRNLTTHTKALKARDIDPDDQTAEAKADMIRAIKAAQEVEEATGEKVSWHEFAATEIGKTQAAAMTNADEPKKEEPVEEEEDE